MALKEPGIVSQYNYIKILQWTLPRVKIAAVFFYLIGKFAYKIKKPSRRDVHCGVRCRCRGATAAGASFASKTLFLTFFSDISSKPIKIFSIL